MSKVTVVMEFDSAEEAAAFLVPVSAVVATVQAASSEAATSMDTAATADASATA
jgi:hypothetical protein